MKRFNWKVLNYCKNGIISILLMILLNYIWWDTYENIAQMIYTNIVIPVFANVLMYLFDDAFKIFIMRPMYEEDEEEVLEDGKDVL
jgi:hypothetical protein